MTIAIHTFVVMWMRKGANNLRVALWVIAAQWFFVLAFCVIAVVSKGSKNYYDPTPVRFFPLRFCGLTSLRISSQYWCWVGERWKGQRLAGEYVWLWLTLLVSICVYVPMFLWIAGHLVVYRTPWWKFSIRLRAKSADLEEDMDVDILRPPSIPSLALLSYVFHPLYRYVRF